MSHIWLPPRPLTNQNKTNPTNKQLTNPTPVIRSAAVQVLQGAVGRKMPDWVDHVKP